MLTTIEDSEVVIIYDFSNLAYCAFFSKAYQFLKTSDGLASGAIFGALNKLLGQLKFLAAKRKVALVFALDSFPQHKVTLVPSYKSNRKDHFTEREDPRPTLKSIFKATNTYFARVEGQEADDVIASLATQLEDKEIYIVSADQDLLQLINSRIEVYNLVQNTFFDKEFLAKKYGLKTFRKIALYKACFGDHSDNIPAALPRVRRSVIIPIINACDGTLADFIEKFWETHQSTKTKELFNNNKKLLKNNYKIIKLNKKLDVKLTANTSNEKIVKSYCRKYQIKRINLEVLL